MAAYSDEAVLFSECFHRCSSFDILNGVFIPSFIFTLHWAWFSTPGHIFCCVNDCIGQGGEKNRRGNREELGCLCW